MKNIARLLEKRMCFVPACKLVIISLAFFLAFLIRFDFSLPAGEWNLFSRLILPLVLIKMTVFWWMGLNHGWWKYVSLADVIDIFKANVTGSACFLLYVALVHGLEGVPRSVLLLDGILCFLLICGVRFTTRAYRENYLPMNSVRENGGKRVLIIGAGYAGQAIVKEMRINDSLTMSVMGYIDDDPAKQNQRFQGVQVLGTREDLNRVTVELRIEEIIIAIPSATGKQLCSIVDCCMEARVKFKTLPGVGDLIDEKVTVQLIKDVDLEDLLGRDTVELDEGRIRNYLQGKRILVTGAAGSIGSEICRQVARFQPESMVLLEKAETPLFYMERELRERFPDLHLTAVIGDIRHRQHIVSVFEDYLPEVVFHAAAYKHVPMMEANPESAVNNNVRGTKIVADAAHSIGVRHFVMISTDKAVNPTNVMGASKRAAELYIQNLSRLSNTHFVTVRFGNVLGSSGSVIPIFKEQIAKGGPLTVTHPDVMRYFMTIPEAAQLVLQAGSMGRGGEIFLLDMGDPVKILNLAEEMIRLSGFTPYEDIDIVFTGLRPGEKLFEELLLSGEGIRSTAHAKIMVAQASYCDWKTLNRQVEDLYQASRNTDAGQVIRTLEEIVPEYRGARRSSPAGRDSVKNLRNWGKGKP